MDTPITRAEYNAYREQCNTEHQRLADEDKRQNQRIAALEDNVRELSALAASVEKLAVNMEGMLKEQEKQGKRLEALEHRDGEMWRKLIGYIVTAIVGVAVGFVARQLGL